ncbi:hypothetical protein OA434_04925 [Candidatus Pelagibacter sp.]|nr:hypothetical protein [Candidatus Pelagibacter sp.]
MNRNCFSVIGNGNHSKRIQAILKKKKVPYFVYKPERSKKYHDKEKFQSVLNSKGVFICTPNNSHFKYINLLKKKYIFCEKPPVTNKSHLDNLIKKKLRKIYFNYNYRFSAIGLFLKKLKKKKLGNLLYGSIISSKGLAYKKIYKNNWRSNKYKCKKGVFELVSIHTIDLLNYYFGIKKINFNYLNNLSKVGNSFDTSDCRVTLKDNGIVQIFSTYCGPFEKKWDLIFQNGIIEINDNKIILRYPRNTFDNNGNFVKPTEKTKIIIKHKIDYNNSLNESIKYFLNVVKKKKLFSTKDYLISLDSNKMII